MDSFKMKTLWIASFIVWDSLAHALSNSKGAPFSPCVESNECGEGYCCAYKSKHKAGFCMPHKRLAELCTTSFLMGKTFTCGCQQGLTCAIVEKDLETGSNKYRCVEIPKEEVERQEKNNATGTITKLLTAQELKRLLDLLKEKEKLTQT